MQKANFFFSQTEILSLSISLPLLFRRQTERVTAKERERERERERARGRDFWEKVRQRVFLLLEGNEQEIIFCVWVTEREREQKLSRESEGETSLLERETERVR